MIDFKLIKGLRQEFLNKTQEEFAEEIGMPIATYQRFERGDSKLTGDAILNIIDIYGVRRQWLKEGVEPIFEKDKTPEPPVGYSILKTDDVIKMQQRMIELQEKVIERHEEKIMRGVTSEK